MSDTKYRNSAAHPCGLPFLREARTRGIASLHRRLYANAWRILIILAVCLHATLLASAQTPSVTISGRVTDDATGAGIADVAIVGEGDRTGTRAVITDAQGNYRLPFGANNNIKVRIYKNRFVFSPALVIFFSSGAFITGTRTADFRGAQFPPILIFAQAPILLTEDESLNGLVLDSVLHSSSPFALSNDNYFGLDKQTRLRLFLVGLDLFSGETLSIVGVEARDAQGRTYLLPVEDLRKVPGMPWMDQLTVKLPSDIIPPSQLIVQVSARGLVSNSVRVQIR